MFLLNQTRLLSDTYLTIKSPFPANVRRKTHKCYWYVLKSMFMGWYQLSYLWLKYISTSLTRKYRFIFKFLPEICSYRGRALVLRADFDTSVCDLDR